MTTGAIQQPHPQLESTPALLGRRRWHIPLLIVLTLALLALFVNRAFNVDEPLFIWTAQQIRQHPLDFYGFPVNWYTATASMATVMKNPPLASYYIALASTIVGWSEVGLHIAFWLPAVGLVLGIFTLARQLTLRPLLAALLALFSPFFLISATTVMCDVLMLCLWVWAVVLWVEGLRRDRAGWLLFAALLAGVAALTKYFGISLLPLMLAAGLFYKRRPGVWMATLLLPVAMLAVYQIYTRHLYGHGLMSDLWAYAASERLTRSGGRIDQLLSGLSFTGGACLGMMPFLALTGSRRSWIVWAVLTLAAITLAVTVDPFPQHHIRTNLGVQWGMLAQLCLFIAAGIATLIAAAAECRRGRDGWLLVLWIFGTFVFAAFCNWSVNGRSILPLVPAAAIVVIRRLPRDDGSARNWQPWLLLPAVALTLLCAAADTAWANTTRDAAQLIAARASQFNSRLLINGHWGFQYYLMQAGGIPCDPRGSDLYRGDIMATAFNNTNLLPTDFPAGTFQRIGHLSVVPFPFLSIMSQSANAGFYAGSWGPLPYAFGPAASERYQLMLFTDPTLPVRNPTPGVR